MKYSKNFASLEKQKAEKTLYKFRLNENKITNQIVSLQEEVSCYTKLYLKHQDMMSLLKIVKFLTMNSLHYLKIY